MCVWEGTKTDSWECQYPIPIVRQRRTNLCMSVSKNERFQVYPFFDNKFKVILPCSSSTSSTRVLNYLDMTYNIKTCFFSFTAISQKYGFLGKKNTPSVVPNFYAYALVETSIYSLIILRKFNGKNKTNKISHGKHISWVGRHGDPEIKLNFGVWCTILLSVMTWNSFKLLLFETSKDASHAALVSFFFFYTFNKEWEK